MLCGRIGDGVSGTQCVDINACNMVSNFILLSVSALCSEDVCENRMHDGRTDLGVPVRSAIIFFVAFISAQHERSSRPMSVVL